MNTDREKLHLWQERLATNDAQYESQRARMDAREELYQGRRRINPIVSTARTANLETPHVRNICAELIESQVDSSIPAPKVTAVRAEDEWLAKIIEDMLRNELDRLPFEEINDLMERTVPIQGGGAYLVEWDNTQRTHTTVGELTVSAIHPKQIVPQAGVYTGIEDMDYIILKIPQTKEYIRRRYGVDVSDESEQESDIKSAGESDSADDLVTQYVAYYRNDAGGIGLYSWVCDKQLEDLEDYQARRLKRCAVCGALEPADGDFDIESAETADVIAAAAAALGLEGTGGQTEDMATEDMGKMAEGDTVTLRFQNGLDRDLTMTVHSISEEDRGQKLVILSSENYLGLTTLLRHQNAQIIFDSYTGLRVPRSAVRILTETITDEDGNELTEKTTGVYCLWGSAARFKPVDIVWQEESYILVTPAEGASSTRTLRTGDEAITAAADLFDGKVINK